MSKSRNKIKLIYNPKAGSKRKLLSANTSPKFEEVKELLDKYQLEVDFAPTRAPKHATKLAKESIKEGYEMVIAAGGDGTVGEVANGLIGSDVKLGILPLGSYMNVARMLSVPFDLEKAVMLLKIGRERKVDVGKITYLEGEKMAVPYYFLEEAGIGIEAMVHYYLTGIFERGEYTNVFKIIKAILFFFVHRTRVFLDDEKVETKAAMVTVSNGPFAGAGLILAPNAKLNDHFFTVKLFTMSKYELLKYLLTLIFHGHPHSRKIKTVKAKKIRVEANEKYLVHADARLFGKTPVKFEIVPGALSVVTGYPISSDPQALKKRTFLDP